MHPCLHFGNNALQMQPITELVKRESQEAASVVQLEAECYCTYLLDKCGVVADVGAGQDGEPGSSFYGEAQSITLLYILD